MPLQRSVQLQNKRVARRSEVRMQPSVGSLCFLGVPYAALRKYTRDRNVTNMPRPHAGNTCFDDASSLQYLCLNGQCAFIITNYAATYIRFRNLYSAGLKFDCSDYLINFAEGSLLQCYYQSLFVAWFHFGFCYIPSLYVGRYLLR